MAVLGSPPVFARESLAPSLFSIRIVTPVYGGGVEAGVNDTVAPIRGASIRGMLRWFWRATRGSSFDSLASLKTREDAIWGSTSNKSVVTLEVLDPMLAPGVPAVREEPGGRKVFERPGYALFPAQSDTIRNIHKSGSFKLLVTHPADLRQDIEAALRAWIWFGGIGARTRRGLGSLVSDSFKLTGPVIQFPGLPSTVDNPKWPMLAGAQYVIGPKCGSPVDAWERAIEFYKGCRQMRRPGQSANRPGRSYWQEPDAIRHLRNQSAPEHRDRVTEGDVFPRGQLGLPIVFHFKTKGDPFPDNNLELSAESDRMASPVIVRPLVVSEREAYPLILTLKTPPVPDELILKQKNAKDLRVNRGEVNLIDWLLTAAEQAWNSNRRFLS